MKYEIDKSLWHICKVCNAKISDLAKIYGGNGIYYTQVFDKHLLEHDISRDIYFTEYCFLEKPKCECNICEQPSRVTTNKRINFCWRHFICGRYKGTLEWSEKAKIERKGTGNPMYGAKPWNKDLTKENSESLQRISEKIIGRKMSKASCEKMSISAKKRLIHGHTGCPHSEETKEICRQHTLRRLKNGDFKQTKTKPHTAFGKILEELNFEYEEESIVGCFTFDYYISSLKLYVEVDGDYFHSNPKMYSNGPVTKTQKLNHSRDGKKNKFCVEKSLKLLRFWENEILNTPDKIKEQLCSLKELLESKGLD